MEIPSPQAVNLRVVLKMRRLEKFPLLLKEGWPQSNKCRVLQELDAAGVVDWLPKPKWAYS